MEIMFNGYCVFLFLIICLQVKCEDNVVKSKNPLPYFRRHVEENTGDTTTQSTTTDNSHNNDIVSFLIKNLKQIYNDLDDPDHQETSTFLPTSTVTSKVFVDTTTRNTTTTVEVSSENVKLPTKNIPLPFNNIELPSETIKLVSESIELPSKNIQLPSENMQLSSENIASPSENIQLSENIELPSTNTIITNNNTMLYYMKSLEPSARTKKMISIKNITNAEPMQYFEKRQYRNLPPLKFSNKSFKNRESSTKISELTENEELMHLSKNLIFFETDRRERDNINYYAHNASYFPSGTDISLRSCIYCNNVLLEDCNDPRNRLIPSTVCERDDDVCYSQHTPFGVVDRGCFNVNHNLTIYICSCNLCNYISISEMPYIFSTKRDWVDNVVELARTKHLRKSVFKDMSCLRCESNASAKTGDMLETANCLEGNIGSVPTELCDETEVCAVKAIKHDGYLWRGCVKKPLFNYWWAFCDTDLCNYDPNPSIYNIEYPI